MTQSNLEKDSLFTENNPDAPRYQGRYNPGKIDGGRALVEWTLTGSGKFSMTGEVWDRQGSDITQGGQCIDDIADAFPQDEKLQRMRRIWERWHLNDMKAGSPRQEAWLKAHRVERDAQGANVRDYYQWATNCLAEAGLNPDREFAYTGSGAVNVKQDRGYIYGSAWVHEEIPADVIAEIVSWSEAPGSTPEEIEPFADFIKSRGITAKIIEADSNPSWINKDDGATHWKATLKLASRRMTVFYSQGSAHTKAPKTGDILRSVVSDAALVDGRDFDNFCSEVGFEKDSRKSESMYKACLKEATKLKALLGEKDYKFALYGEEE